MNKLKPILVRAFGRSGTTLMMQLLASSEKCVLEKRYPYEDRFLSYFYRLSDVIDKEVVNTHDMHWGANEVNEGGSPIVGGLPYLPTSIVDLKELKARFFQAMWNQFSQCVHEARKREGDICTKLIYYAEKVSLQIANDVNSLLPETKNIFLIRDPRAELVSIQRFNEKRGFLAFGWEKDESIYKYASRMIKSRKGFFNAVSKYLEGDFEKYIVIRYEDLIVNLPEETKKISDWLGISLDHCEVLANRDNMLHHITSSTNEQSIEGWVNYLEDEVKEIFVEQMSDELHRLGYRTI